MADFSSNERKKLALNKEAMPDGSYPIRNSADLKNAIQAYGRASDKPAVKEWIKKRAIELGLSDLIPEDWKDKDSLAHYGILGMHWGVRRSVGSNGKITSKKESEGSEDYQKSRKLKSKGSKNLSTQELKELTTRLELEKKYKDLKPSKYKKGMNFVKAVSVTGASVASLYGLSKTPLGQDVKKAITMALKKSADLEKVKWVL
jgi:hypothetical protein